MGKYEPLCQPSDGLAGAEKVGRRHRVSHFRYSRITWSVVQLEESGMFHRDVESILVDENGDLK